MYTEYDLLEQIGIWELYEETHTSSETLVEIGNLKAHKKSVQANLWVRKYEPMPTCEQDLFIDSKSFMALLDNQLVVMQKYLEFEFQFKEGESWLMWVELAFLSVMITIQHFPCTICGCQTMVRQYTEKENLDTRTCYKCFYQGQFVFLMCWTIASFCLQITQYTRAHEIEL